MPPLYVKNLNQWNTKAPLNISRLRGAVHAVQFPRPQAQGDDALLIAAIALAIIKIAVAPHGKEGKGHQWDAIPKSSL